MPIAKVLTALPVALVLSSLGAAALSGCDDEGPAERAGKAVDEAAQDAGRAAKDAAD